MTEEKQYNCLECGVLCTLAPGRTFYYPKIEGYCETCWAAICKKLRKEIDDADPMKQIKDELASLKERVSKLEGKSPKEPLEREPPPKEPINPGSTEYLKDMRCPDCGDDMLFLEYSVDPMGSWRFLYIFCMNGHVVKKWEVK